MLRHYHVRQAEELHMLHCQHSCAVVQHAQHCKVLARHRSKTYLQVPLCLLSTALITLMDHFLKLAPQLCVHVLKHISPVDGLLHHSRGNQLICEF